MADEPLTQMERRVVEVLRSCPRATRHTISDALQAHGLHAAQKRIERALEHLRDKGVVASEPGDGHMLYWRMGDSTPAGKA